MTEVWQAGKTYVPGALARPTSGPPAVQTVPNNPNFEDDLTGWTVSGAAGWVAVTDKVYDGTKAAKYIGSGISALVNNIRAPVTPGQSITAFCVISLDHIASDISAGRIQIYWFNASNAFISSTDAAVLNKNHAGNWQQSLIAGTAPADAAFASIAISANADAASFIRVDGTGWYYTYGGPPNGLAYKAVQAAPGKSGSTEPAWPPTLGTTVVDNEVTWEAVIASQIVYTARPINRSGATEPVWPTTTGGFVHDGTIDWEAITPQVTDVNCPHSKIVVIAASKVYAADNDIIRYSATVNPLDWTTADDAGYIPFGLQTYGSNPAAAMNLYRSNVVVFNAEGFQMWQVDEDPSSTALLDALPIGSTRNGALAPVANDLFFLSSQGVRTVGVAASSTNLQAGDVGMPVDPLIQEAMRYTTSPPLATYVPSLGQYWLAFSEWPPGELAITGDLPDGVVNVPIAPYTYGHVGGFPPVSFTISSGSLPPGLSLSSAGRVTGTPTVAGTYNWQVTGVDTFGGIAVLPDSCVIAAYPYDPDVDGLKYLLQNYPITHDYVGIGYDDSAWAESIMPLGTSDRPDAVAYGFPAHIQIAWPLTKACYLRGRFDLSSARPMKIAIYVDDAAGIFINGSFFRDFIVSGTGAPGDPLVYYFEDTIPESYFVSGTNLISVICNGSLFGVNNYIDFSLEVA